MQARRLIKTDAIEMDGRVYTIKYFELMTRQGEQRYCSELVLGPDDRIIIDGSSLGLLEWRVARLMPASLHSRMLARTATT